MVHPYSRVILFHFTIMVGFALMVGLRGSPVLLVVALVAIKTAMDLVLHRVVRRRPVAPTVPGPSVQPARVA